jgi:hypothetical protein
VDIDLDFKPLVAKPASTTVCSRCGAMPTLVKTLLDSRKGKSVMILKCKCGNETWREDIS